MTSGAFFCVFMLEKLKKPDLLRMFTTAAIILLLILLNFYFNSNNQTMEEKIMKWGGYLSSFLAGYAITIIILTFFGYRELEKRNRIINTLGLSFGLIIGQMGVVLAFYFIEGTIKEEIILLIAYILASLGIIAAIFGGRFLKSAQWFKKFKPKKPNQQKIATILLFSLVLGNFVSGIIPIHNTNRNNENNFDTRPLSAQFPSESEIYDYDSIAFHSPFGSCTHNNETDGIIEDHKAAGFGWWRKDWTWNAFQKENSSDWHFEEFDQLVQKFNTKDMYMIPLVSYVPKWACNNTGKYCDQLLEEWKIFVRTIVSRYKGNKSITCWEIWNEPNIDEELFYDPYFYSLLLVEAGKIIRELDPKSLILAGGTSSMNLGNWGYYKRIFELNTIGPENVRGKIIFDVINLRLYQETYRGSLYEIMKIRELADSYGFTLHSSGRGAIWITETGKLTQQKNWPNDHLYQAEFLSKVAISSIYSGIAKIFYYVWFGEQYFGIIIIIYK